MVTVGALAEILVVLDRVGVVGGHIVGVGRSAQVAQQLNSKGELAFCVGLLGVIARYGTTNEGDLVHIGVRKCGICEGRFSLASFQVLSLVLVGLFGVGLDGDNGIAVLNSVHARRRCQQSWQRR